VLIPKEDEVHEQVRVLHKKGLDDVYRSLSVVRTVKSRRCICREERDRELHWWILVHNAHFKGPERSDRVTITGILRM